MSITTCAVSGYIYDPFGVALANQTVSFLPRDWVAGTDGIVVPKTKTATTDGSGLLSSVPLVPGIYKVVFADPAIAGRTQFTISVPATTTANLQDIADFTGQVRQAGFLDGTAGSPVWTFVNDTNTGVFRPSDDTLGFSTGGVSRMTVSNAGATLAGLLTGTAVTQTATDTTAGRLLKVGDFGVGANDPQGNSALVLPDWLSTGQATGFHHMGSDTVTVNKPAGISGAGWGSAITIKTSTGIGARLGWRGYREATEFYMQKYDSGGWGSLLKFFNNRNIVGAVSQVSGVPDGAIIERGSNANGEYVRFADGTQICTALLTINSTITSAHLGGYRNNGQTWVYPAAFAAAPRVTGAPNNLNSFAVFASNVTGTTACSVFHLSVASQATAADLIASVTAIGRWF